MCGDGLEGYEKVSKSWRDDAGSAGDLFGVPLTCMLADRIASLWGNHVPWSLPWGTEFGSLDRQALISQI